MPMKAAVREMLPPKRMIWALRYSRSNTSRASRSGRAMIRSAPDGAGRGRLTATSAGSISAVIGSAGSPEARISMPLDVVAQLAHVARPVVHLQRGDARRRPACARGRPVASADPLDEVVDQLGDVLAPLGQARHAHRHHVQAVEQVLAEAARGDLLAQVARGRGDHAHVHLHVAGRRRRGGSAARPAPAGCGPGSRAACRPTSSR